MEHNEENSWKLIRPDSSPVLDVFGVRVTLLAGALETGGACSVAWISCDPGPGAPPHRHLETERFHVIRGRLTVMAGGEETHLAPGDSIVIGPWTVHAFSNTTDEVVEFVAIGSPAGHDAFFRDADELARSGRFNPDSAREMSRKHGIEVLI